MVRMLPALLVTALVAIPGLVAAQPGAPVAASPGATNAAPVIPPSGTLGAPPAGTAAPAPPVAASVPSVAQSGQRGRMTACNGTASDRNLKGAARQSYMSACLSGKTTPATMMKVCNAQASQDKLSADDRRGYLSSCLKTSG